MKEGKRRVALGVSAGIAVYKSCDLVRRLMERGCDVRVVMTKHATRMVSPITFQALSGNAVITGLFNKDGAPSIFHIELAEWEELLLVAPATADILGKFAHGIADDFLSTHYLANRGAPVLLVPTMNGNMYRHPAVRENLRILEARGHTLMKPASGVLACGDADEGRLPEPAEIAGKALSLLEGKGGLAGVRVLVTAGPTREAVDAVRYLTNRSSGKMGYAAAREAVKRGASVTLLSGPVALAPPAGVAFQGVTTAAEMDAAVLRSFPACDVLVMAAAVADYRPAAASSSKRKKNREPWTVELEPTTDILSGLKALKKPGQFVCGFAAETEDLVANARKKLEAKGLDLIAANDVSLTGVGFDSERNALTLLWPGNGEESIPNVSKDECARFLWDTIMERMRG